MRMRWKRKMKKETGSRKIVETDQLNSKFYIVV